MKFDKEYIIFSAATITLGTATVVDVEEHVITCELGGIVGPETDVKWSTASAASITTEAAKYTVDTGSGAYSTNAQTSTLTIAAAEMASLRATAATQTFTCTVPVGINNGQDVTATQTITILEPSKKILLQ